MFLCCLCTVSHIPPLFREQCCFLADSRRAAPLYAQQAQPHACCLAGYTVPAKQHNVSTRGIVCPACVLSDVRLMFVFIFMDNCHSLLLETSCFHPSMFCASIGATPLNNLSSLDWFFAVTLVYVTIRYSTAANSVTILVGQSFPPLWHH